MSVGGGKVGIVFNAETADAKKQIAEVGGALKQVGGDTSEADKRFEALESELKKTQGELAKTQAELQKVGDQAKKAGQAAAGGAKGADDMALAFQKMSSMELAGKIQEIAGAIDNMGNITAGVAENDVGKFRSGMEGATKAAVAGAVLIAPAFAPVVAILGVVIGKVAEWALGMASAEDAIKSMNEELKRHNEELDRTNALAKIGATTSEEVFKIEQDFLKKRIEANNTAMERLRDAGQTESAEHIKLNEDTNKLIDQVAYNAAVRREEIRREKAATAIDVANGMFDGIEHRAEQHVETLKKGAEEAKKDKEKADKEARDLEVAGNEARLQGVEDANAIIQETMAEANQKEIDAQKFMFEQEAQARDDASAHLQETLQSDLEAIELSTVTEEESSRRKVEAYQRVAASADATAAQRKAAERAVSAEMKKQQDAQKKSTEATYNYIYQFTTGLFTNWKGTISKLLDDLTKKWIDSMLAQAAATVDSAQQSSNATTVQAGAFKGAQASITSAAIASIPPKVASSFAGLGPIGMALATAAIAFFLGMARKQVGLEEGGTVPGAGRRGDFFPLAPGVQAEGDEEVIRRDIASRPGVRPFLQRVNRGENPASAAAASGFGVATGGGSSQLVATLRIDEASIPSDRQLYRMLLRGMTIEVRQHNGTLEASHLR